MRLLVPCLLAAAACTSPPTGPRPDDGHELQDVAHADGRFVAVGGRFADDLGVVGDAVVATSTDGDSWDVIELPGESLLWAVAHGDGRWVAAGGQLVDTAAGFVEHASVLVSDDAVTWWRAELAPDAHLSGVAYGNGVFVAAAASAPRFYVSADGEAWTTVDVGAYWWSAELAFVDDRFVAYGEGSAIAESIDGVTWQLADTGLTFIDAVVDRDGAAVGVGYHDCCYGEVPEAVDHVVLEGPGTWTLRGQDGAYLHDLAFVDGAVIAVAGDDVVRAPAADAPSWAFAPVHADVGRAALAADGTTVVAAGRGLHVSHDAGRTWTEVSP